MEYPREWQFLKILKSSNKKVSAAAVGGKIASKLNQGNIKLPQPILKLPVLKI